MNDTIQTIIDAIKRQEHHNAENLCWLALKKEPNSPEINKWLGISLLQQKKYEGGIAAFLKTLPEKKSDFDVNNNLAFAYRHTEDYENALKYLDKAEKIMPNQYAVSINRAHICMSLKKFDEALLHTKRCFELIKMIPLENIASYKAIQNFYVEILLARNEVDEAIHLMKTELDKKFDARLFYNLSNTDPEKIDEKIKLQAKQFALDKDKYFIHRSAAFLGLGRICEKEKKYKDAFDHYKTGNKIKSEKLRYKPFLSQEIIKENINYFNKYDYKKTYNKFDQNYLLRGKNLIFVVGNPRSGTTLVESILGSSDNVTSAGELNALSRMAPKSFHDITSEEILNIGNEYLRIIDNFREDEKQQFIIDKMPANIYQVGLIKLCLPSSKIICLNRRPLDNAWSIFTQLYLGNIPYSSDLFNLGVALANVEALKKFWLSQNDSKNFHIVNYEEIVRDPHEYSKQIYNFVGVKGEYDEEKRKTFSSRTASKTQVKRDIYTTSISRSKDYDIFLEEFEKSYENQNMYWKKYFEDQKII
tara:strand:+ start:3265 stop:4857 length:1593 start_codon:yes stop_codon:yes gene_type:complete